MSETVRINQQAPGRQTYDFEQGVTVQGQRPTNAQGANAARPAQAAAPSAASGSAMQVSAGPQQAAAAAPPAPTLAERNQQAAARTLANPELARIPRPAADPASARNTEAPAQTRTRCREEVQREEDPLGRAAITGNAIELLGGGMAVGVASRAHHLAEAAAEALHHGATAVEGLTPMLANAAEAGVEARARGAGPGVREVALRAEASWAQAMTEGVAGALLPGGGLAASAGWSVAMNTGRGLEQGDRVNACFRRERTEQGERIRGDVEMRNRALEDLRLPPGQSTFPINLELMASNRVYHDTVMRGLRGMAAQ